MTHKEVANRVIANYLISLMAYDDGSRRLFEIHVGESLDWYEYSDDDKEKIYNEIVNLVGDFSKPME